MSKCDLDTLIIKLKIPMGGSKSTQAPPPPKNNGSTREAGRIWLAQLKQEQENIER